MTKPTMSKEQALTAANKLGIDLPKNVTNAWIVGFIQGSLAVYHRVKDAVEAEPGPEDVTPKAPAVCDCCKCKDTKENLVIDLDPEVAKHLTAWATNEYFSGVDISPVITKVCRRCLRNLEGVADLMTKER